MDNSKNMNNFNVTLIATSYKDVAISACTEDEAMDMARSIYMNSDALEFTKDDIDMISFEAYEIESNDYVETDDYEDDFCEGDCIHCIKKQKNQCKLFEYGGNNEDESEDEYDRLHEDLADALYGARLAIENICDCIDELQEYYEG